MTEPWRTLAICAMTGDNLWSLPSLECGTFNLHEGWQKYISDLFYTKSAQGAATVHGMDCIRFLKRFDAIVLWHWPNESILSALRSGPEPAPKIGLAIAYESIPQEAMWGRKTEVLRQVGLAHLLKGTQKNRFGYDWVDPYEMVDSNVGFKPHCYSVDIGNLQYAENFLNAVEWTVGLNYKRDRPDFYFYDCFQERPYYGTATNAPPITDSGVQDYQRGWEKLLREHQGRIGPVWGHNPGDGYWNLKNRVHEHFFRSNYDADTIRAQSAVGNVGIGSERNDLPTKEAWAKLREEAGDNRPRNVYVQTARTGSAFALFHPGFTVCR
jgi:hypothetical protein